MFTDDEEDKSEESEEEKKDDEAIEIEQIGATDFLASNFANIPELNMKKLVLLMSHLNHTMEEGIMDYDLWLDMYSEWLKYMKHLGPYVAVGI